MKTKNLLLGMFICCIIAIANTANAQDVLWKRSFGGIWGDKYLSVTSVSDGIVAVGYSSHYSFGTGDWTDVTAKGVGSIYYPEDDEYDAIIVKYNNIGDVVWKKNFGGNDEDVYNSVTAVSDGIIAVGYSGISSFGSGDWVGVMGKGRGNAIIVKYDNSGNVVWKKNFGENGVYSYWYSSVTIVSDGIIVVGGYTGELFSNAIIVKYNKDGNMVWKKDFGENGEYYYGYSSVITVSDGIVTVGYNTWNTIDSHKSITIIVKYDNNGNIVWKKDFGENDYDFYSSVTKVSDGIVAVGTIIVKYDNNGNIVWKKTDGYNSVTTVSDGIIAVGRRGKHIIDDDFEDILIFDAIISKYDNIGNLLWQNTFDGCSDLSTTYNSVTALSDGIVAVGEYGGSIYGGIGEGDCTGFDAIIVKYNGGNASGLNDIQISNGLSLSPNPAKETLIIKNEELRMGDYSIFNVSGQVLMQGALSTETTTINVKSLPSGMYFIKVGNRTGKFIKE